MNKLKDNWYIRFLKMRIEELEKEIETKERYIRMALGRKNCYSCIRGESCQWAPKWGEHIRVNCPHWKEEIDGSETKEYG